MDEDQQPDTATMPPTQEAVPQEPIKDVGTFWERLDEVLQLVKTGGATQNKQLEEILDQFPQYEKVSGDDYKSFIFQPERIAISSNDDQTLVTARDNSLYTSGHASAERFSSFRINFRKALRNVKSIQLLSAVIPNATQNIPDESVCFFYYKLRSIQEASQGEWNGFPIYIPGDLVTIAALNQSYACKVQNNGINPSVTYWTLSPLTATLTWNATTAYVAGTRVLYNGVAYSCVTDNTNIIPGQVYWIPITVPPVPTLPNYYDLNPYHINVVYLFPTFGYPPESEVLANQNGFNRTFQDYADLVTALNFCVTNIGAFYPANSTATIPDDITFQYNATLNKIQMIPNPAEVAAGYYYLPCGYADPNIQAYMDSNSALTFFGLNVPGVFVSQTTLNLRLGYTWNGIFPDPFSTGTVLANLNFISTLLWYLRPKNPALAPWAQDLLTFNSYPDLVNTGSVRIYADITLGSTEDSSNEGGLLSVVPVNANNLGVAFYQNNFNNPLTKIPRNITELGIRMLTDNGLPYYLPNSATVLLELAITYY